MLVNKRILIALLILLPAMANAQTYEDSLLKDRAAYVAGLLEGTHPLKTADTGFVRFYKPDRDYRVPATFVQTIGARPFQVTMVHGGTRPVVMEYGIVYFNLNGAPLILHIYRLMTRPEDNTNESIRLFIPFSDGTNYHETFGGGRYLDISADNLVSNNVIIDFNKCYNPHTAYEKGFPYIISPDINHLRVNVKAGEKIFGHNPGY